jgi:hypothetical protein
MTEWLQAPKGTVSPTMMRKPFGCIGIEMLYVKTLPGLNRPFLLIQTAE